MGPFPLPGTTSVGDENVKMAPTFRGAPHLTLTMYKGRSAQPTSHLASAMLASVATQCPNHQFTGGSIPSVVESLHGYRIVGLLSAVDSSRHSRSLERRVARYTATMLLLPRMSPVKTPISVNT
jgi:hypothetical protein